MSDHIVCTFHIAQGETILIESIGFAGRNTTSTASSWYNQTSKAAEILIDDNTGQ